MVESFFLNLKNQIIFADLKLNDIPNTCVSDKAIKDLKINYLTMHISSGLSTLRAVKKSDEQSKVSRSDNSCASLDNKALKEIGYNKDVKKISSPSARLANKAKCDAASM